MGGEQTDAFLLHPGDMAVAPTLNSSDVFTILNARRGTPVTAPAAAVETLPATRAWAPRNLLLGIAQVGTWLKLAARALRLDPEAYREVTQNPLMTGPALLIGVVASLVTSLAQKGQVDLGAGLSWIFRSLVATLIIYGAGYILRGRRKRGAPPVAYTSVFRGMGFAQAAAIFELLALIPPVAPFARVLAVSLTVVGAWLAAAVALDLRGWRGILLPVAMIFVFVASFALTIVLAQGAALTISSLAAQLGFSR
jgi:hypothetical protein